MDFQLTSAQEELRRTVREFARKELSAQAFRPERPPDFVRSTARRLSELGLTGITFPAVDGGQGGELLDAMIVLREISEVCPHSGDVVQAYNFGGIRQVQALASPLLKEQILGPALRGEILLSLAMSEPDAGSGLSGIRTRARINGDVVTVNGSKIFATHGVDADVLIVWARFGDDRGSIGAVAVPADTPGFRRGPTERFMSGEPYCEMFFDECSVPTTNVLVAEDGIRRLMPVFNIERLGNATRALALATTAFRLAVDHASNREIGGVLLKDRQGIRWKCADMKMKLDAADMLLLRAAVAPGGPGDEETALAKCFANEAAFSVAHESLQMFGGYGYSTEYPLEYIFRRVRGWMIAGGTVEVLRDRIAQAVFNSGR